MTEVRGGQGVSNQKYIDKNCAYIDVYIQSDRLDVCLTSLDPEFIFLLLRVSKVLG